MSDELEQLLEQVPDPEVRESLGQMFGKWRGSRLRSERDEATSRAEAAEAKIRRSAYRIAGVPEGAYDILDDVYDGDAEDIGAVRDYAASIGLKLDALDGGDDNTPKQDEPDPRLPKWYREEHYGEDEA